MGHSRQTGSLTWSPEVLRALDWKRFQDLVGSILAHAGYGLTTVQARPSGEKICWITSSRSRWRKKKESLLLLAGWGPLTVPRREIDYFLEQVQEEKAPAGVMIVPGSYSIDALQRGRQERLELVDGPSLLATLRDLPESQQAELLSLATSGDWQIPTCPSCGGRMMQRDCEVPEYDGKLPDRKFPRHETVTRELRCQTLTVARSADVLFLKPVYAKRLHIAGQANGLFYCDGTLVVERGAVLSGRVAARAVDIQPGGLLEGNATIVPHGPLEFDPPLPRPLLWGCPDYPHCDAVLPLRDPAPPAPTTPFPFVVGQAG